MNATQITATLRRVLYRDWSIGCAIDNSGKCFIWWYWLAPCTKTGVVGLQTGRKWYVEEPSTDSLIKTALMAAIACETHECVENFKVDGATPFDPHTPVRYLITASGA